MNIELIHLQGFKSAADIRLENVESFAVLAGANGAGKSNLVDGLAFFGAVVSRGVAQAIREFGGFGSIHCFRRSGKEAATASLELKICLGGERYHYFIKVHDMDGGPRLEESLFIDDQQRIDRQLSSGNIKLILGPDMNGTSGFSGGMSALVFFSELNLYEFLTNIQVFRFDPQRAKEPDSSSADATMLDSYGRNVATMLGEIEKKPETREQVLEWLELLVPGMESVSTQQQHLDGSTVITFKEEGTESQFPARLISDGTIYALCIMTALLSRSNEFGLTIIEEPERGIHPKAITELVTLMRDNASVDHPVFITTHSESIVRSVKPAELWLVNKVDG